MAAITIGLQDFSSYFGGSLGFINYTVLYNVLPADGTGNVTSITIRGVTSLLGTKIGTFYGSGTTYTNRGYASIGTIAGGSPVTVSGLLIAVSVGDLIGRFVTSGDTSALSYSGASYLYSSGDKMGGGSVSYNSLEFDTILVMGGVGTTPSVGKKWNGITISKWNGVAVSKINSI